MNGLEHRIVSTLDISFSFSNIKMLFVLPELPLSLSLRPSLQLPNFVVLDLLHIVLPKNSYRSRDKLIKQAAKLAIGS